MTPPKPSILQNVVAQLTGQAGVIGLQLVYVVVVARRLDIESFGIFSFAFALVQMVLIFADLGLNLVCVRQISASPTDSLEIFGRILSLKMILSVLVGGMLAAGAFLSPTDRVTAATVSLFALGLILHSISLSFNMAFQAHGQLYMASLMTFFMVLFQLTLGSGFLAGGGGVMSLGWAYVLAAAMVLALNYFLFTGRIHKVSWTAEPESWMQLLRLALPLALGSMFSSLANRIDVVILLYLANASQVALYSAAYRITGALNNIPVAIFAAVLPLLSRQSWKTAEMDNLVERTLLISCAGGGAVLLLFSTAGPQILVLLFGENYRASGAILRILIWAVVPAFVNLAFLHASASQKSTASLYPVAAGAGVVANLLLNFSWIPLWEARGAAAATVATELVMLTVYLILLRQSVRIRSFRRPAVSLGIALAGALAASWLSLQGLAWAVAALAAYLGCLLATGGLLRDDWRFWKQRALNDE